MSDKQRQRLVFILGIIFIIVTPLVILFSQGYLFDWQKLRFVKAGGIYLKTIPEDVEIYLKSSNNPKERKILPEKSLFGSQGTLIKNLLPQNYQIRIVQASTIQPVWTKEFLVEPLTVSKATRIIFPIINPIIEKAFIATSSLDLITEIPNQPQNFIALDSKNILYSFRNQSLEKIIDLKTFSGFKPTLKIKKIEPSNNGENLLIWNGESPLLIKNKNAFAINNLFRLFFSNEKIKIEKTKFAWHENNDQILFALTDKGGYFFDLEKNDFAKFTDKKIKIINESYFLDSQNNLFQFDYQNQDSEKLIQATGLNENSSASKLINLPENQFLIQETNDSLWLINPKETIIISSSTDKIFLDKNKTRLAVFEKNHNLFIFFLKDIFDDLAYFKNEKINLGQFENIEKAYFANYDWHLIAVSPETIKIFEIDKRKPNNFSLNTGEILKTLRFENNSLFWINNQQELCQAKVIP